MTCKMVTFVARSPFASLLHPTHMYPFIVPCLPSPAYLCCLEVDLQGLHLLVSLADWLPVKLSQWNTGELGGMRREKLEDFFPDASMPWQVYLA